MISLSKLDELIDEFEKVNFPRRKRME